MPPGELYDAFGNEKDRVGSDSNPFRYCGEYFDVESGAYYLRARYYDPSVGRFTQEDTHWNTSNMIYGDEPQQIGEYEDPLGTSRYVYAPQITAVMQAGNLYNYCGHNPIYYSDFTGKEWYHWVIGGVIVVAAAVAVVATAGGALPALYAVGAVAGGSAAATASATAAAGAFIGASAAFGYELLVADCSSIENFNASGSWKTVAFTAGGLLVGGAYGYTLYQNNNIRIAGKGSTGRTEAKNKNEAQAMKTVLSDPLKDAKDLSKLKKPLIVNDAKHGWFAKDGWVKMARNVDGVEIHFLYNTITGEFDDFKFK